MDSIYKSALLVLDMQVAILKNYGAAAALTAQVGRALTQARARNIPVIYAVVGFRPGTPEISRNNKSFSAGRERFEAIGSEEFSRIEPAVAPRAGEPVVFKRRISAFTGSDLEVILRSQNIRHLVLTGISTSGVILSTVREAADKDYALTVLSDGCGDGDEEVHRVLTGKIFLRQAEVMTVAEWCK
jgi:nicotinamidase-related amidase